MTDVLITNGLDITQNESREVLENGAVAVTDDRISDVGSATQLERQTSPGRLINAGGGAIIPGLINAHTHVSDIFSGGRLLVIEGSTTGYST